MLLMGLFKIEITFFPSLLVLFLKFLHQGHDRWFDIEMVHAVKIKLFILKGSVVIFFDRKIKLGCM